MLVKELLKELKGKYTTIIPINDKHQNAIPFTQLGKEFHGLHGKAFDKVLGEKEVVSYTLGEPHKVACWTNKEFTSGIGHYETTIKLTIVFKGE